MRRPFLVLCGILVMLTAVNRPIASRAGEAEKNRLFELRTYTTAEGKLDALHARFRNHTNRLFAKHGMTMIGYWTPAEGDKAGHTLVYLLAFPDRAARDQAWREFGADPEWQKVFRESRQDGPLVTKVESLFLSPTDYSELK